MKTSELEKFEKLLQAKRPNECTDEEIKQVVRYCMLLVGIRASTISAMDEMEKLVLIEFIKTRFTKLTIDEIKMAFTKAVAYELDVDPKHYENFSCEYFGRIISAYKVWAQQMHNDLYKNKREEDEYLALPPHEKYNPLELVEVYYKEFLSNNFNIKTATEVGYDAVVKIFGEPFGQDVISMSINEAYLETIAFYERSYSESRNSRFGQAFLNSKQKLISLENKIEDRTVSRNAKLILLKKWFEMLRDKNIESVLNYKP